MISLVFTKCTFLFFKDFIDLIVLLLNRSLLYCVSCHLLLFLEIYFICELLHLFSDAFILLFWHHIDFLLNRNYDTLYFFVISDCTFLILVCILIYFEGHTAEHIRDFSCLFAWGGSLLQWSNNYMGCWWFNPSQL